MVVTGKNFKLDAAKGIFPIEAFRAIHRIDLYRLAFTENLCSFVTGHLRALVQFVRQQRWGAGCQKARKEHSQKHTHNPVDVLVIGSLHGIYSLYSGFTACITLGTYTKLYQKTASNRIKGAGPTGCTETTPKRLAHLLEDRFDHELDFDPLPSPVLISDNKVRGHQKDMRNLLLLCRNF